MTSLFLQVSLLINNSIPFENSTVHYDSIEDVKALINNNNG
jgi:hypothetical protein